MKKYKSLLFLISLSYILGSSAAVYGNVNLFSQIQEETNSDAEQELSEQEKNKKQLVEFNQCPGCDLNNQDLSGLNLRNANLIKASLVNANLTGSDLRGAVLINAKLCNANLVNTDLRGANLTLANFSNANLTYAKLSNRTYRAEQINLEECDDCRGYLRTKAYGTNFSAARLDDADIEGLGTISKNNPQLKVLGPWLTLSNLRGSNLRRANLKRVDLSYANLSNANLSGIAGAELHNFSLFGAVGANLEEADLRGAIFNDLTDFQGANLKNATSNMEMIKRAQLLRAVLPSGRLNTSLDNTQLSLEDLTGIQDALEFTMPLGPASSQPTSAQC